MSGSSALVGIALRAAIWLAVIYCTRRPRPMGIIAAMLVLRISTQDVLTAPDALRSTEHSGATLFAAVAAWVAVVLYGLWHCGVTTRSLGRIAFSLIVGWWLYAEEAVHAAVSDPDVVALAEAIGLGVSGVAVAAVEAVIPTSPPSPPPSTPPSPPPSPRP